MAKSIMKQEMETWLKRECRDQAYHIYEAHEYAHAASGAALKRDKRDAEMYLNLMRHEFEAADLQREVLQDLNEEMVEAAKYIKEGAKQAVYPLGNILDKTKVLMFEKVVECQCGKP